MPEDRGTLCSASGQNYQLKSDFQKTPLLRSGYFPKYLAKDNLSVDPEAALI